MRTFLKENKWFLIPFCIVWTCGLITVLIFPKQDIHLFLNTCHNGILDFIFKYGTEAGNLLPFLACFFIFFYGFNAGIFMVSSQLLTTVTVQILKRIFNHERPSLFFSQHYPESTLEFVPGVVMESTYSFPSGHTAAAFTLFFTLSILIKNNCLKSLCFLCAVFAAYSRIYLSQHFLDDTLFGSIIAVLSVTGCYFLLKKKKNMQIEKKE